MYSSIVNFINEQTRSNPNAAIVMGSDRINVSMDSNQAGRQ